MNTLGAFHTNWPYKKLFRNVTIRRLDLTRGTLGRCYTPLKVLAIAIAVIIILFLSASISSVRLQLSGFGMQPDATRVHCRMLFTYWIIPFSASGAQSRLCLWVVFNVSKVCGGVNADIRYGSILKVNVVKTDNRLELDMKSRGVKTLLR